MAVVAMRESGIPRVRRTIWLQSGLGQDASDRWVLPRPAVDWRFRTVPPSRVQPVLMGLGQAAGPSAHEALVELAEQVEAQVNAGTRRGGLIDEVQAAAGVGVDGDYGPVTAGVLEYLLERPPPRTRTGAVTAYTPPPGSYVGLAIGGLLYAVCPAKVVVARALRRDLRGPAWDAAAEAALRELAAAWDGSFRVVALDPETIHVLPGVGEGPNLFEQVQTAIEGWGEFARAVQVEVERGAVCPMVAAEPEPPPPEPEPPPPEPEPPPPAPPVAVPPAPIPYRAPRVPKIDALVAAYRAAVAEAEGLPADEFRVAEATAFGALQAGVDGLIEEARGAAEAAGQAVASEEFRRHRAGLITRAEYDRRVDIVQSKVDAYVTALEELRARAAAVERVLPFEPIVIQPTRRPFPWWAVGLGLGALAVGGVVAATQARRR